METKWTVFADSSKINDDSGKLSLFKLPYVFNLKDDSLPVGWPSLCNVTEPWLEMETDSWKRSD